MTDILKPSVQAFLVCDQVIEDSLTKKKSLIGIFTHLQAVVFPFQHQLAEMKIPLQKKLLNDLNYLSDLY